MVTHPTENSTHIKIPVLKMGNFYSLAQNGTENLEVNLEGNNKAMFGMMLVLDEKAYDNSSETFTLNINMKGEEQKTYVMDGALWRRVLVGLKTHFDYIGV